MKIKTLAMVLLVALWGSTGMQAQEKISRQDILNGGDEWREGYRNHRIDERLLAELRAKIPPNLVIEVYLALWCHDSRVNLPKFIKIMDRLEDSRIQINYYSCRRKAGPEVRFYVENRQVTRIPTFIFYHQDREVGRIVENPRYTLIEDMIDLLSHHPPKTF